MSRLWEKIGRRVMFGFDAERAHELGMKALTTGAAAKLLGVDVDELSEGLDVELFGLNFKNPLGIAAGFDKNGVAVNHLAALGFGFVEVGTVTYEPQPGNDKPRLFRLPADHALINRLGFNNEGALAVAKRLSSLKHKCIVGINIGKNKSVPNEVAVENYLKSFNLVHPVADYVAINISSPNTPDLRELQKGDSLDELVSAIQRRNLELGQKPLLVKIAPDLSDGEIETAADKCLVHNIDGIIATNTTISRAGLKTTNVARFGAGGLSGEPLKTRSNAVIKLIYKHTKGQLPIIGVGGVFNGEDAFQKIANGASLVQAYTGFVYGGPRFPADTLTALSSILKEHGFTSLIDAVGSEAGL